MDKQLLLGYNNLYRLILCEVNMRVITGTARGRRLKTLEGIDVRPTTDKVKEAIFSIIQFDIEGSEVLDLFSGSGQMGIEALSRGARHAYFIDKSKQAVEATKENLKTTALENNADVINIDSLDYIKTCRNTFDIAIIDPPYDRGLIMQVMPILEPKMSERGIVVCEHEIGLELPESVGKLIKNKTYKYGKIEVTIFRTDFNNE